MSAGVLKCPLCRRTGWVTVDGLAGHMAGHTPRSLADRLLEVIADLDEVRRAVRTADAPPASVQGCGKASYRSEDEALRTLLTIWKRPGYRRAECRAYFCAPCGAWHLTKQPERTTT